MGPRVRNKSFPQKTLEVRRASNWRVRGWPLEGERAAVGPACGAVIRVRLGRVGAVGGRAAIRGASTRKAASDWSRCAQAECEGEKSGEESGNESQTATGCGLHWRDIQEVAGRVQLVYTK